MPITQVSLEELQNRYPNGIKKEGHGCFYFLDNDGELGYFIQFTNGNFEDEVGYVDFDAISEDELEDIREVMKEIG